MDILRTCEQTIRHCLLRLRHGQGQPTEEPDEGARAEALAAHFLRAQGARILARNVRFKGGEIDLIALHQQHLVFVEVRLRQQALAFGGAAGSITAQKQLRIALAARLWLLHQGRAHAQRPMRFDAIVLDALREDAIVWLQAAFYA
jgi:putative endonuclease